MTPNRRSLLAVTAAGLLAAMNGPAQAQLSVFDLSAVNQAIKQVSQGLQQIQALQNQIQLQESMVQRLGTDVTGPLREITTQATGLLKQAQGIGYNATNLNQSFAQAYPTNLNGQSSQALSAQLAAWDAASRQTLQEAMQVQGQIAQAQPSTTGAVNAAVAASQGAAGQTAAIQATNQLLAALSTQLLQLQTLLITQARQAQTLEAERQAEAAKGEADRTRNSVIKRAPARFSGDTL
jgi:P-type conjugative transfer protein TrbJ